MASTPEQKRQHIRETSARVRKRPSWMNAPLGEPAPKPIAPPKLTPVAFRLPAPWGYVHACYCGTTGNWYLEGPKGYWREGLGWFKDTPTRYADPMSAANFFLKAMAIKEADRG